MSYRVLLRNTVTGVERWVPFPEEWGNIHEYMWTDGNFGCDCNRGMFFAQAGGEPDPNLKCSGEVIAAICAVLPDGTQIELDDLSTGDNT